MKHYIYAVTLLLFLNQAFADSTAKYDLETVQYMDRFIGSKKAKDILSQRGFVVTDQQFNQIFGAYIAHDHDRPAPAKFITVDSAWHTYHVLLEESVKNLEEGQAEALLIFSSHLYKTASALIKQPDDMYADLARFAAVAMVMQNPASLESIDQRDQDQVGSIVHQLTQETGQASVLFFGTPVSSESFRASSFYTADFVLRGYFTARQWYALCNFRANSKPETERAMLLALLIDGDAELKKLYDKLTAPYTKLLGPPDDSGVEEYLTLAEKIAGEHLTAESIAIHLDDFQKAASGLPAPKVNDQYFPDRDSYKHWADDSKGFRLFGSRRLPSAVLFQNTLDPAIEGRMVPSGLDFFATGPLVCDAGKRALQADEQIRPFAKKILDATPEPLPDSLHGEALKVLSLLQVPLPESAPQPLRTRAWADKQLWTELGAWAEQRHTWALHTKITIHYFGLTEEPPGYVSPYPDFFRELANLSRNTAAAFESFGETELNPKQAGRKLLHGVALLEKLLIDQEEPPESEYALLDQLSAFATHYMELTDQEEFPEEDPQQFIDKLRALGERWIAEHADPNDDEQLIRFLLCPAGDTKNLLPEFAELCDALAEIAQKELNGTALSEEDAQFIEDYGKKLGRFHFYGGNSWLTPRDDFPMVTPIFMSPVRQEMLYAGLSRPEALYIILDFNGKPVLHRGAVLSYREFLRPTSSPLDDDHWKEEVRSGTVPPPPAFTASFRETMSKEEVLDIIKSGGIYRDVDRIPGREITQAMIDLMLNPAPGYEHEYWLRESLCRRAEPEDVGSLIEILKKVGRDDVGDIAICIANLPWKAHRDELMKLLHHKTIQYADSAAYIMSNNPADIDVSALLERFDSQWSRTKRLYCYLLGHSKNKEAVSLLIKSLQAKDAGLRYQAAEALGTAGIKTPGIVDALVRALDDPNDCVAKEAADSLYHMDAKEAAPAMLKWLMEADKYEKGERRYGGCRDSHRKEVFDNTSYSGYGCIMVLAEKERYGGADFIPVHELKQWAEDQLKQEGADGANTGSAGGKD